MLNKNVAYLYVDEESLKIFKSTSCEIGVMIGHKQERKGIVKEIIPILPEFIQIFQKFSVAKDEILKYSINKPYRRNEDEKVDDKFLIETNKRILYSLNEKEIDMINKFIIVSNMCVESLFTLGIFVKCLNDESRPSLTPKNILEVLGNMFDWNLKDFIVLTLNKATFAKMQCKSANFGEIDYMLRKDLENDLIHFSLKTNLEFNRMFYINCEYSIKEKEEIFENFQLSLKNSINNSFYYLSIKNESNNYFKLESDQILKESEEIKNGGKEILIKMMIPSFLLDFENSSNRNCKKGKKIMTKFKSKIILDFYIESEIKYEELIIIIKNRLYDVINHSMKRIKSDLDKSHLSSANIINITLEDKCYVNYNDSIEFVYDKECFGNYTVRIKILIYIFLDRGTFRDIGFM